MHGKKWYGLDNSFVIQESVPLITGMGEKEARIRRLDEPSEFPEHHTDDPERKTGHLLSDDIIEP